MDLLSRKAVENGLGARYLKSVIKNSLDEMIFEDPDLRVYEIDICDSAEKIPSSGY